MNVRLRIGLGFGLVVRVGWGRGGGEGGVWKGRRGCQELPINKR